jgi:hypothetical protein
MSIGFTTRGRLVAFVERRSAVQRLAAVALLEFFRDGRLADRDDTAAFTLELVEMLSFSRCQHHELRRCLRPAKRAHKRQRATAVLFVGDKSRKGLPR